MVEIVSVEEVASVAVAPGTEEAVPILYGHSGTSLEYFFLYLLCAVFPYFPVS